MGHSDLCELAIAKPGRNVPALCRIQSPITVSKRATKGQCPEFDESSPYLELCSYKIHSDFVHPSISKSP
jgi:hypothetical protein